MSDENHYDNREELQVEDAMRFNEEVKHTFRFAPEKYDEFLDILTSFKNDDIDTPGVIKKAIVLFRDNPELIPGFNTFLPPLHQITPEDLRVAREVLQANLEAEQAEKRAAAALRESGNGNSSAKAASTGRSPWQNWYDRTKNYPQPARKQDDLKVEDALNYLDEVKFVFRYDPGTYNDFLDVMKAFKNDTLDTPGVVERVSRLFRGHSALILGFNTFLPPQHQITEEDIQSFALAGGADGGSGEAQDAPDVEAMDVADAGGSGGGGGDGPANGADDAGRVKKEEEKAKEEPEGGRNGAEAAKGGGGGGKGGSDEEGGDGGSGGGGGSYSQPPEFDHAISYVTTIKKRFHSEPQIYKAFLEILHTYQKEAKGIKEVLEQVSTLFADHPDLLNSFTYFLPDAVQEQAKEHLSRAAAEAEARQAARINASRRKAERDAGGGRSSKAGYGTRGGGKNAQAQAASSRGRILKSSQRTAQAAAAALADDEEDEDEMRVAGTRYAQAPERGDRRRSPGAGKDISSSGGGISRQKRAADTRAAAAAARRAAKASGRGSPSTVPTAGGIAAAAAAAAAAGATVSVTYGPSAQRQLFEEIRESLYSSNRAAQWQDLVKLLELYGGGSLKREETLRLLEPILGRSQLGEKLRALLGAADGGVGVRAEPWFGTPLSAVEFGAARGCTPSYRRLPPSYARPPCSGRSLAEAAVLNDHWVSVPEGSEESGSFKHLRKNQFEDALFRCEDERYELDMAIGANAATIRRLEPVVREISALAVMATKPLAPLDNAGSGAGTNCAAGGGGGSSGGSYAAGHAASHPGENGAAAADENGEESNYGIVELPPARFEYRLNPKTMGTLHWMAIVRIYGAEHAPEVLNALRTNPAAAVPIVLSRLRQKDAEWRTVRQEMNVQWKEQVERNYHKALDKRTFFFRTVDRASYLPNLLLTEVRLRKTGDNPLLTHYLDATTVVPKPALPSGGPASAAGSRRAAVEAAAAAAAAAAANEEELAEADLAALKAGGAAAAEAAAGAVPAAPSPVPMMDFKSLDSLLSRPRRSPVRKRVAHEELERAFEVTCMAREERAVRERSAPTYMCPHTMVRYSLPSAETAVATERAAALIKYAMEGSQFNAADRESMAAVLDFIPRFFSGPQLPPTGSPYPAIPTLSSDDEDVDSTPDDTESVVSAPVPAPAGAAAGDSAGKEESETLAGTAAAAAAEEEAAAAAAAAVPELPEMAARLPPPQSILFCNADMYVLLREHHLLTERLTVAARLCKEADDAVIKDNVATNPAQAVPPAVAASAAASAAANGAAARSNGAAARGNGAGSGTETRFETLMALVYSWVDGSVNGERFDEACRQLVGGGGYVLCTLDRVLRSLLKVLARVSADGVSLKLQKLFEYEAAEGAALDADGNMLGMPLKDYRREASILLHRRRSEQMFRVQYQAPSVRENGEAVAATLLAEHLGDLNAPPEANRAAMLDWLKEEVSALKELAAAAAAEEEEEEEVAAVKPAPGGGESGGEGSDVGTRDENGDELADGEDAEEDLAPANSRRSGGGRGSRRGVNPSRRGGGGGTNVSRGNSRRGNPRSGGGGGGGGSRLGPRGGRGPARRGNRRSYSDSEAEAEVEELASMAAASDDEDADGAKQEVRSVQGSADGDEGAPEDVGDGGGGDIGDDGVADNEGTDVDMDGAADGDADADGDAPPRGMKRKAEEETNGDGGAGGSGASGGSGRRRRAGFEPADEEENNPPARKRK